MFWRTSSAIRPQGDGASGGKLDGGFLAWRFFKAGIWILKRYRHGAV